MRKLEFKANLPKIHPGMAMQMGDQVVLNLTKARHHVSQKSIFSKGLLQARHRSECSMCR